jgi:thiol-disulfide isomerase/thioredoxin
MKTLPAMTLILLLAIVAAAAGMFTARHLYRNGGEAAAPESLNSVVGKPAPGLVLPAAAGGEINLQSLRGKTVLVNFWATWCGPCIEEMPLLDRFAESRKDSGLVVLGIAVDDREAVQEFLMEHPVAYPIGLGTAGSPDESTTFGNRRGVLPYSVLIDASGVIRRTEVGSFDEDELVAWVDGALE